MAVYNKRVDVIPEGAIYVGRPTVYGNPYHAGIDGTLEDVVRKFETYARNKVGMVRMIKATLKGKDLICWCDKNAPCHAKVLDKIANEE